MVFSNRIVRLLVVASLLGFLVAGPAIAAKQFRLKFKEGDVFKVTMNQDTKQTISVMGRDQEMPMNMVMTMTWNVKKVNADKTFEMTQTIDRVQMTMNLPGQGAMKYDSDSKEAAAGPLAAMLGGLFKPMIKTEFKQKMDPRGEILEVKIPDEALKGLSSNPLLKKFFSKEAMKEMVTKMSPVLPEQAIDKGFSWSSKVETPAPFGKMVITSKYTYEGEEQRDNKTLDKFSLSVNMAIDASGDAAAGASFKVQSQKSSGTLYFDSEAGYFVSNSIKQDMTLGGQAAGQAFTQKVQTETRMTTVPVSKQ